jgi:hypothetical protein
VAQKLAHESLFRNPNVIHGYSSFAPILTFRNPRAIHNESELLLSQPCRFFWLFMFPYIGGCQALVENGSPGFSPTASSNPSFGDTSSASSTISGFSSFVTLNNGHRPPVGAVSTPAICSSNPQVIFKISPHWTCLSRSDLWRKVRQPISRFLSFPSIILFKFVNSFFFTLISLYSPKPHQSLTQSSE